MLSLPPSVRIFLCVQPADMRRSFDGLSRMVEEFLGHDPFSGHLFVFRNKRGDRMKLLYWDNDGYAIWYKRLEKGVFRFPEHCVDGAEVAASTLTMLLEGVDLSSVKHHPRYVRRQRRPA